MINRRLVILLAAVVLALISLLSSSHFVSEFDESAPVEKAEKTISSTNSNDNLLFDAAFYALPKDERFKVFQGQAQEYFSAPFDCNTKYIYAEIFCDASPGNGLKLLLQPLILGFILNRKLVIRIHRQSQCEGVYLDFKHDNVLITTHPETQLDCVRKRREQCASPTTMFTWQIPAEVNLAKENLFSCFDFARHQRDSTIFFFTPWTELLSDIQFNHAHLSTEELARARRVFSQGLVPSMGMLLRHVFDVTQRVRAEFLEWDYRPDPSVLARLFDPGVLKVGLHIRHLPFIVKDEGGSYANIDKRAFKCLNTAVAEHEKAFPKEQSSCMVIVATDVKTLRNAAHLAPHMPTFRGASCVPYIVTRTGFNHSEEWGAPSFSAWEARKSKDLRGHMEAYLDLFVLSEYSNFMVIGSGSTFSNLIAIWNLRHPGVNKMVEFQSSSCKDKYFAFHTCCVTRRRWSDVYIRQGALQPHEPC